MFSSDAYEAFYVYIGTFLHEASIQIITSQSFLIALMVLLLGWFFLSSSWSYFSKFSPFGLSSKSAGLGVFFKVMACFLIGMSLLKVNTRTEIKNPTRVSWHDNKFIELNFPRVERSYSVSFLFDLMTSSAEEVAHFANQVIDNLFKKTNSQLDAPSVFYKSVMWASSQTIDDPELRDLVDAYTGQCFERALPLIGEGKKQEKIDEFYRENGVIDQELALIPVTTERGEDISCLDLKNRTRSRLNEYGRRVAKKSTLHNTLLNQNLVGDEFFKNQITSSALVNHYLSKKEDFLGIQNEAKPPTGAVGKIFMYTGRLFSFDGVLSLLGQKDAIGAALSAKRALEFSEYLRRASHLKGVIKMLLIAVFPWLVFFVIVGRWKVIVSWWAIYFSVLLWTPIWTLFYHLMTSMALSIETLETFGKLNFDVSLYGAKLLEHKFYEFYTIYYYIQLAVGPMLTGAVSYGLFQMLLNDREQETTPQAVRTVTSTAKKLL